MSWRQTTHQNEDLVNESSLSPVQPILGSPQARGPVYAEVITCLVAMVEQAWVFQGLALSRDRSLRIQGGIADV